MNNNRNVNGDLDSAAHAQARANNVATRPLPPAGLGNVGMENLNVVGANVPPNGNGVNVGM